MNSIFYVIIKGLLGFIVGFIFVLAVLIKPNLITRDGIRTRTLDNIVRGFAFLLILMLIVSVKPLLIDTFYVFRNGISYISKDRCELIRETHSVYFPFLQKVLYCRDKKSFCDRFTARFYHVGDVYELAYLPKSRLIVKVYNVYEKNNN